MAGAAAGTAVGVVVGRLARGRRLAVVVTALVSLAGEWPRDGCGCGTPPR